MAFALVPQGFRFEVITSRLSYDEAKVFLRPRADADPDTHFRSMSGRTSGDDVSLSLPGLTRQSISLAPRYPDQPYYDGVAGDIAKAGLKAVPVPVVTPAPIVVPTPTPVVVQPLPPPTPACADTSSDANTDGTDRCGPQPKVSRPSWAPLVRGDVTTQIGCPPVKPAPYLPFALSTSIVSPLLAER